MSIRIKRAYLPADPADGSRVLVDRVWPRGVSRDRLDLHTWLPVVAPGTALRKWFGHDPAKWPEFKRRYFDELRAHEEAVDGLVALARRGTLTLVFGARDERYNNAAALREYLDHELQHRGAHDGPEPPAG